MDDISLLIGGPYQQETKKHYSGTSSVLEMRPPKEQRIMMVQKVWKLFCTTPRGLSPLKPPAFAARFGMRSFLRVPLSLEAWFVGWLGNDKLWPLVSESAATAKESLTREGDSAPEDDRASRNCGLSPRAGGREWWEKFLSEEKGQTVTFAKGSEKALIANNS